MVVFLSPPVSSPHHTHFGFLIKSTPDITDRTHGVAGNWSPSSSPAGGLASVGTLPTRRVPCRAARALARVRVRARWVSMPGGMRRGRECTRVGGGAHNEFARVSAFLCVLWRPSRPPPPPHKTSVVPFCCAMRVTRALAALRPRLAMQSCSAATNAPPTAASASSFLAVNVYVSEGRAPTLATLTAAASSRQSVRGDGHTTTGAALVHTFVDEPYNRTGFTLAGPAPHPPLSGLTAATLALCDAALAAIDWDAAATLVAAATHPALGAVDHIAVHPLFPTAPGARASAAGLATTLATSLGDRGIPVYLYGWASPAGRTLAEARRSLGYFGGGKKDGADATTAPPPPDAGPPTPHPRHGVAIIGATPWVVNVNVPLATGDVAAARAIARRVSTRGGGPLPALEAMGLAHGDGCTEVACNVRDPEAVSVEAVEEAVKAAADAAGVSVSGGAYVTGRGASVDVAAEAARVLGCAIVHE